MHGPTARLDCPVCGQHTVTVEWRVEDGRFVVDQWWTRCPCADSPLVDHDAYRETVMGWARDYPVSGLEYERVEA